ncbi:MAG: HAD-IA family hydrolase, partial [Deinococcota bacterium]
EKMYDTWRAGSIGTITLEQVHEQTAAVLGISPEQVALLMGDLWTEYLGSLNTELYDYFKNLRHKFTTAILSNSFVGAREKEQAQYGFEDSCDLIIYSHEVGVSKPDPKIYELTCQRLKLAPHEIIFVDDVTVIIEAAVDFGLHGVLFENNQQTISSIESLIAREDT